ncbi:MAG: flagellar basal body-associated FliL family protein [Pseudomonadota bacterium]
MTNEAMTGDDYAARTAALPRRALSGRNLTFALVLLLVAGAAILAVMRFAPAGASPAAGPQYVEVPDIMVNLAGDNGTSNYLKVRVMLEVPSAADGRAVEAHLPAILDGFQGYLRTLGPRDLSGSAGTFRVKEALLRRVNLAVHPARASDVLIQEMIQQ